MKRLVSVAAALVCIALLALPLWNTHAYADDFGAYANFLHAYADLIDEMDDLDADDESESDGIGRQSTKFTGPMVKVKIGSKTVEIHKDFKEAMDDYEDFFKEYVIFMKNPDLSHYADFMSEYASYMAALDDVAECDLTDEEFSYYFEVYANIMHLLAEYDG